MDYLIKWYNEFASMDEDRPTKFSFGALSKNIESQFGGPWKLLSAEIFDGVCQYIQGRISKTRIAKWNVSRGYPAFSTKDEFLAKHLSRQEQAPARRRRRRFAAPPKSLHQDPQL